MYSHDDESLIAFLTVLTNDMVRISNDYDLLFHKCLKVLIGRQKSKIIDKKISIPIMDVYCTPNCTKRNNEFFCKRVVAYFTSHLKDDKCIISYEYNERYKKYRITAVIANSNLVHKINDLNIT